jgi:hypothetical protein
MKVWLIRSQTVLRRTIFALAGCRRNRTRLGRHKGFIDKDQPVWAERA